MKNRDRFVELRPQDVKVYACKVLFEAGKPVERIIDAGRAAAIGRKNQARIKQAIKTRRRRRKRARY
jgi:hypothetical protein